MIISSTIVKVEPQPDGRKYITEEHKTDDGQRILVNYLLDSGDPDLKMAARVAALDAQLLQVKDDAKNALLLTKVNDKHTAYLKSLAAQDIKTTFGLANDEELVALKSLYGI